jgi:hypothetical protein
MGKKLVGIAHFFTWMMLVVGDSDDDDISLQTE